MWRETATTLWCSLDRHISLVSRKNHDRDEGDASSRTERSCDGADPGGKERTPTGPAAPLPAGPLTTFASSVPGPGDALLVSHLGDRVATEGQAVGNRESAHTGADGEDEGDQAQNTSHGRCLG